MKLQNKAIVITGVSSGIGAEAARVLRSYGAKVIGVDRNEPMLTVDAFFQADLGNEKAIDDLVSQLPTDIDALCNIAGVPGTVPMSLVANVNYLGLRDLTQKLLPKMNEDASVVNISSVLGYFWPERIDKHKALASTASFNEGEKWLEQNTVDEHTCYQYFKEALIVWTAVHALPTFKAHGIRMNTIAPGPVMTPILDDFVTMVGEKQVTEDAERMTRPALADEVGDVVAFMCADESRWINGANIPVDGGFASTYM